MIIDQSECLICYFLCTELTLFCTAFILTNQIWVIFSCILLIAKEIFVHLQEHYKETKFRWIRKQVIRTVRCWKWGQILLNICGDWQALTLMLAFSSFLFLCELRLMVIKCILLLCYFFIDCFKVMFTCYYVLFPIKFCLLKKNSHSIKYIFICSLKNLDLLNFHSIKNIFIR